MSVPGNLYTPTIRKTRGADYLIEQSLLFNDNDSPYLTRTPSTVGNRKTWTFSVWVKRATITANQTIFIVNDVVNEGVAFAPDDTVALYIYYTGGAWSGLYYSQAKLRDPSAWYHIVVAVDTTQSTAANRVRLWINGVEDSLTTSSTVPQNQDTPINKTIEHRIGAVISNTNYFDGFIALPILVDGAALDPTSFGELDDDGYWNPIEFKGATGF